MFELLMTLKTISRLTTNTISISSSNAIIHMLFVLRPSRRYAHTISPLLIALIFNSLIILFISSFNLVLGLITLLSYLLIGVLIPLYADHKCAKAGDRPGVFL